MKPESAPAVFEVIWLTNANQLPFSHNQHGGKIMRRTVKSNKPTIQNTAEICH